MCIRDRGIAQHCPKKVHILLTGSPHPHRLCFARRSALSAKPACQKDDETYQQNEADTASAERWPTKIETAATEQEKKHDYK